LGPVEAWPELLKLYGPRSDRSFMRKYFAAAFAGLLALAAAGCGGGSGGLKVQATADFLAGAAQRTAGEHTGHMELEAVTTIAGRTVTFGATGAFDAINDRVQMEMRLASLIDQLGSDSDAAAMRRILGDSIEIRVVDGVMYMKFPFLAVLGGQQHTDWISIDTKTTGLSDQAFGPGPGTDPSAFLEYLRGAGTDVQELGHEDVRGVDTTHLAATIVLRHALDSAPEELRARMQTQLEKLGAGADQFVDTPIPVDVFIDSDGLVRRLRMQFSAPVGGEALAIDMRIDFFDFGAPVDIQAPDASQVTDITDKIESLGGTLAN